MNAFLCIAQENNIIRYATLNDLDAVAELAQQMYYEHYKPFLQKMPAVIGLEEDLDDLIEKTLRRVNNATQEFIIKQQDNEPCGVLVICDTNNTLLGSCRFKKIDNNILYIFSFAINKRFQRMGLGTKLLSAVMNIFDDIIACKLRAFVDNHQAHNFYQKYGFQKVGATALNLSSCEVIVDSSVPPTHIDYQFIVQK